MTLSSLAFRGARRLLLVPAVFALTTGVLAGCSDSATTSTTTGAATTSATESSAPAGTVPVGETVAGEELVGRMQSALEKAGTYRTQSLQAGLSQPARSDVVIKDGVTSSHTTVDTGGEMRIIALANGEELYLKSESVGVPTWTEVEAGSDNPMIATMAGMLETLRPMMDPTAQLRIYEGVEFTSAGSEDVDGVATTRYTAEVPMGELLADMAGGAELPPEMADMNVPVEIFLDADDRPAKVVTTTQGQASEITYSDFGADITVQAPTVGS